MTVELLLSIAGLAVLDMLSPTTIAVTIGVLLTGGTRVGRLLVVYWVTLTVAYFLLGVVLMLGLGAAFAAIGEAMALWIQAAIGAGLLVGSFFITDRPPEQVKARSTPRALTPAAMIVLGMGTWTFEAATAVPYFAAIALMTSAALTVWQWLPILAGYTLVMIVPCVALLGAWTLSGDRLRPRLERWRAKLSTGSRTALSWIVGIAGFLILRDAIWRLLVDIGVIDLPGL